MDVDGLAVLLTTVTGVTVATDQNTITVHVGGDVPALTIPASQVLDAHTQPDPRGLACVKVVMADPSKPRHRLPLYVTSGDVAFPPDPARGNADIYSGGPSFTVTDLPPGISYLEMARDFEQWPGTDTNLDRIQARVLALAAFWWGAHRVGLNVEHLRPKLDEQISRLRAL